MNKAVLILKENKQIIKQLTFWIWAWLVPMAVLGVLGVKIFEGPWLNFSLSTQTNGYLLLAALVLLPLNIWLETIKWKTLISPWIQVSIKDCSQVILAGKSLNAISPLGIGEAFAKYTQFDANASDQAVASIAIARMTQMIPTLVFGLFSILYLIALGEDMTTVFKFLTALIIVAVVLVWLAVRLSKRISIWLLEYWTIATSVEISVLLKVLLLSFFRYAVFTIQFLLVFYALDVDLNLTIVLPGVFWIFLIKTVIPNLSALGDLANRELSAIAYFSFFMVEMELVTFAGFCIWVINIVMPALLGVVYIKNLKTAWR